MLRKRLRKRPRNRLRKRPRLRMRMRMRIVTYSPPMWMTEYWPLVSWLSSQALRLPWSSTTGTLSTPEKVLRKH